MSPQQNENHDHNNNIEKEQDTIHLQRFPHLYLALNTPKGIELFPCKVKQIMDLTCHPFIPGRAVYPSSRIPRGTIIDTSPVLILSRQENTTHIAQTQLYHYTYNWPSTITTNGQSSRGIPQQAVVLGLGSMFNHSTQNQNVGWKRDLERQVIVYTALKDIEVGEELCISYGDHLTFVDVDAVATGTGTVEGEEGEGDGGLGRIDL